uniref:Uncharacterized protein n=1 Tax=Ditylenchus dipsaci TaxID=166011 RepID=A0A915E277_9BILA
MTMHENPLYKPPPTAQATLVKQSPPTTTTFTSAGPKMSNPGLGRLGSSSTVAPRTNQGAIAALGQRLPPPYVAAL